MNFPFSRCACPCIVVILLAGLVPAGAKEVNWPQFRGPGSSGIAEGFQTPTTWSVPDSRNLKWKTPIPGLGHSCPIVWGDRIFLTTALSDRERDSLKIGIYHEIAPV